MKIERQLDGLITAIAEGLRSGGLQARLDALEGERDDIARRLAEAPPSPVRQHPNLADVYRAKVDDETTRDEAFGIIRSLIDKVVVHARAEGGCEIELIGEIASMVEIAFAGNKKAALLGRLLIWLRGQDLNL